MCLLNGDLGGSIPQDHDFGTIDIFDENIQDYVNTKVPIKELLKQAIHTYGNEPYHNIIINDIDDYGVELLEYRGDKNSPLYLFKSDALGYINMSLDKNKKCWIEGKEIAIGDLEKHKYSYDNLVDLINGVNTKFIDGTKVKLTNEENAIEYTIAKIEYGQTAGYRLTELVYAGDLFLNAGEPLTSLFDKIKTMLGDYEYFYDIDGKFIFQRTKTYLSNPWNSIVKKQEENDLYVQSSAFTSAYSYTFHDSHLFTSIANTPQLNNIKNDIALHGVRKGVLDGEIPVYMRYAIDSKPEEYINFKNEKYTSEYYDWREIIYQMALDYSNHNQEDDFLYKIASKNFNKYPTGYTGYEKYYTDILGFWRTLYMLPELAWDPDKKEETKIPKENVQYYTRNEDLIFNKVNFSDITQLLIPSHEIQYYIKDETGSFGEPQTVLTEFDPEKEYYIKDENNNYIKVNIYKYKDDNIDYYYLKDNNYDINTFYHNNIKENPGALDFWFDFIGEGSEIEKFSVQAIGDRVKTIVDDKITGIYFKEVPTVLFITSEEWNAMAGQPTQTGYTYIKINKTLDGFFNISSQGKSAHETMEETLYNHTYAADTISLTSIPIYYLRPNTRISVKDSSSGIYGEYIVSRISLPLNYNGLMNITASRVPEVVY